jgi:hypothetical protein
LLPAAAWQEYQRYLRELLAKTECGDVGCQQVVPDADRFSDTLHLNEEGAKEFSRRLGALCGNVNQLNSCGNWERVLQGIYKRARARCVFPDGIVSPKSWFEVAGSPA